MIGRRAADTRPVDYAPEVDLASPVPPAWPLPGWGGRAGTVTRYAQGDTLRPADADFDGLIPFDGVSYDYFRGHPTPVASFPPNGWGLYDMAGTVWEWTADEYCPYATGSVVDPHLSCGTDTVVIRGGSWYFSADAARGGRRYIHARQDSGFSLGFRVVREIGSRSEARHAGAD